MKKKLAVMAILLSAVCLIGFAQEMPKSETSLYLAKETKNEEKEYTFIVSGQVKINNEWVFKKEKFTIIAKSRGYAETRARNTFINMYKGYSKQGITIICESTKNACQI